MRRLPYGTLIFSGPLAAYASQGVGLVLFGNFAACLVIALAGGFRGAISGLSPALIVVMALIGATTAAEGHALFVTVAGALVMSAVATGAFFVLIGRYRLANLVRFVPYPVAGGFVAGIGAAVCLAAMSLMGAEPGWRTIPALLQPAALGKWIPGAAFGLALYLAMKRWRPFLDPAGQRRACRRRNPPLTSGRASAFGAEGARLLQYGPGDPIWSVAPSDDGAPTVLADGACEALVLAPDARRWLEEHRERLALDLYRYLLAARFETEAVARPPKGASRPGPDAPP